MSKELDYELVLNFISDHLSLIPEKEEKYIFNLKKLLDGVGQAKKAANTDEKKAYLYVLYAQNAISLAENLYSWGYRSNEDWETYKTLPTDQENKAVLEPYLKERKTTMEAIQSEQAKFTEHDREIEIFKGVALGDSPKKATKKVTEYEQEVAQTLAAQQAARQ